MTFKKELKRLTDDAVSAQASCSRTGFALDAFRRFATPIEVQELFTEIERLTAETQKDVRPWTGEGLPPVGTVCEMHRETYFEIDWQPVTLLCVGQAKAFFRDKEGHEWSRPIRELSFRPLRTPEQIAAEEREHELNRMVATVSMLDKGWARKVCAGLYDAGYRKFEIVDEQP